jgi:small basic protein (TIGR04137 family)
MDATGPSRVESMSLPFAESLAAGTPCPTDMRSPLALSGPFVTIRDSISDGKPLAARRLKHTQDATMTIDRSLKVSRGLISNRSVLSRAERVEKLMADEKWSEGMSPLGMPKVRVLKLTMKKKKKVKKEDEED